MMRPLADYRVTGLATPGVSGDWSVTRFTVSAKDEELGRLTSIFGGSGRYVPAGDYTALKHGRGTIMSDTPDEIRDLRPLFTRASGDVLIAGLGLGVAARGVMLNEDVKLVTVIEKSPDVIALTQPWLAAFAADRGVSLLILEDDILSWRPSRGIRYTCAWFDIWNAISTDNLTEMAKLHRAFARRVDWYGSWSQHQCQRLQKRGW